LPGSAFQREYLGVPWTPSPEEKRLRELTREYHERTEAYDRTACSGLPSDRVAHDYPGQDSDCESMETAAEAGLV
jgi:hypothetical protein